MDTFVPQRFGPRWQGVAVGRPGIEDALSMISTEPWIDRHGDSMWSFLAGSVVTAVVGFLFYYLGKRTKSLDSLPISATSILTIPSSERAKLPLAVVANGREVADPNLVVVRIMNTGREAIGRGEFA